MTKRELFSKFWYETHLKRYDRAQDLLRTILCEEVEAKINDHNRSFGNIALVAENPSEWVQEFAPQFSITPVSFADILDFPKKDYDLVLHLGALHVSEDILGQMVQSLRVLAPDGAFIAGFLGGESLVELRTALMEAEIETQGGASPRVMPMVDIKDAGDLLMRAGFALPVADRLGLRFSYEDTWALMRALRYMGLSNPLAARRKNFTKRVVFDRLDTIYAERFGVDGKIPARFELVFLTAYAPSDTQPVPKARGSAQVLLADALQLPYKDGDLGDT